MNLNYEEMGILIKAVRYWLSRHPKESIERVKVEKLLGRLFNLET